ASGQTYPLTSLDGIQLHKVKAEPVTFKGRKAVRVTDAGESNEDRIAILTRSEFQDGTIEVDVAGEPGPGASQQARGFAGIAFRVTPDASRFECFYVRHTN